VVSLSQVGDALWIGTVSAGAYEFRQRSATRVAALEGMGTLWSAVDDGAGGTFVGTSRGLFRLSKDRSEVWLSGVDVRAVALAGGTAGGVWCATVGQGLVRVRVEDSVGVVTARVGTDHGLPSDSVYAVSASGAAEMSVLAVGTNRGVATYGLAERPPGLRIAKVVGRRVHGPEEWGALRLDRSESSLLVEVAAVGGRTYPEHYQYLFTLAPDHSTPHSTLTHDGQFLTGPLPSGRYVLEARALSTDLIASAPIRLAVEVPRAPLPWVSMGLGALLLVALLALGWGTHQNRRLAESNAALAETRLQLVQETEAERRRIARDLHDQTLADLRRLLLAGGQGGGSLAVRPDAGFRDAVEAISTEVRRICEDLSPSVLENVGLTAALEWALGEALAQHLTPSAERVADEALTHRPGSSGERGTVGGLTPQMAGSVCRGRFVCAAEVEDRLDLDSATCIQVYRIVQEALTNAVRHSGATELVVGVELAADHALVISVEDNGCGFEAGSTPAGRGLANMRSRASLIGAMVEWPPRPGGGTVFRLRLPHRPATSD